MLMREFLQHVRTSGLFRNFQGQNVASWSVKSKVGFAEGNKGNGGRRIPGIIRGTWKMLRQGSDANSGSELLIATDYILARSSFTMSGGEGAEGKEGARRLKG